MKIIDCTLPFKGLHGRDSSCGLQVYSPCMEGKSVVVFTEISDNKGTSVTNFVEKLIAIVIDRYSVAKNSIWVEHYPKSRIRGETYDLVDFCGGSVRWQHISRAKFLEIISAAELPVCI